MWSNGVRAMSCALTSGPASICVISSLSCREDERAGSRNDDDGEGDEAQRGQDVGGQPFGEGGNGPAWLRAGSCAPSRRAGALSTAAVSRSIRRCLTSARSFQGGQLAQRRVVLDRFRKARDLPEVHVLLGIRYVVHDHDPHGLCRPAGARSRPRSDSSRWRRTAPLHPVTRPWGHAQPWPMPVLAAVSRPATAPAKSKPLREIRDRLDQGREEIEDFSLVDLGKLDEPPFLECIEETFHAAAPLRHFSVDSEFL